MNEPRLCSRDWESARLPVWGSAKDAAVIVAVESAGSWGRSAADEEGFRAPRGAALYLVRRPGRHAVTPDLRTVIISGGFGDDPWLVEGRLDDESIASLLTADIRDHDTWRTFGLEPSTQPLLLVCTHGARDACCAVRGRPVAQAAAEAASARVWEVSHIGGHRFAPTAIHLPTGQTFGRLTEADGESLATARMGDSVPAALFSRDKHRGRVDLSSAQRVAETWWRETTSDDVLGAPVHLGEAQSYEVGTAVRLPDGRTLLVSTLPGPALRDSCVKNAKPSKIFDAQILD